MLPSRYATVSRLRPESGIPTPIMSIATSRVYLGAHYPLDVAAGAGLGALSGVVARALLC